jgi:hypothetical protein
MAAQNLANTKNDLIISLVQKELREKVNLLPTITDLSQFAGKGVKSINVPKLSSFTVQDRAFGAAGTEAQLTDATDTINLDKNKQVLFPIDKADELQSSIDYMMTAVTHAASAHARQIDADIITLIESVADISINAGTPADITTDDILSMREHLFSNNADMTQVVFCIAPDQEKVMLGLPEFSRFEYRGIGPAPVINGQIGAVYGVPVVINNQIKAQQAFMYERSGMGIAFQQQPQVGEQKDVRYGANGVLVSVDQLYGLGGLQLGELTAGATESPLVTKLTD